jgi:hypothetical protein
VFFFIIILRNWMGISIGGCLPWWAYNMHSSSGQTANELVVKK